MHQATPVSVQRNRDYDAIATMSLPDWKVNKAVMRYINNLKEKSVYGLQLYRDSQNRKLSNLKKSSQFRFRKTLATTFKHLQQYQGQQ